MDPTFKCQDCGFTTESYDQMNEHSQNMKHSFSLDEEVIPIGGKTVTEATGIPDEVMGSGRGAGDATTGAKDAMDDAEQNDKDPIV